MHVAVLAHSSVRSLLTALPPARNAPRTNQDAKTFSEGI
ncbi:hypothetical protein Ptr902_10338 [Pyrenophora tritici-repentis]|uniref:Uncharacterized protein n=1 Tax=Pyrenophora tritici-repentis TaxID=45151 RepID=A0A5M9KT80_9PLEO|nr:hypothetical protein PtrV1_10853 [Pyrenophora tritici-repentis]KAF7566311.1 hypothetical protein PtrM4_146310 [Pyrenophora tritici-repentis]KAI0576311.1 hypothetical protein Alg215_07544 [Pyrenophora tritici-repentis]KAI0583789.1 hypothetical protein Alg130_05489 [Pyrenophora tritici-repentis]KAI0609357.1 hypothetical protein TUN205_06390 [Pyrenophora tritici-repentis]